MNREQRIIQELGQLSPLFLKVINESHKHAGHTQHLGGAGFTGETHYKVVIQSAHFDELSRLERQRLVMDLLKTEFEQGLHALELKVYTSKEAIQGLS